MPIVGDAAWPIVYPLANHNEYDAGWLLIILTAFAARNKRKTGGGLKKS